MKQEMLHGRQRQLLALLRAQQGIVTSSELAVRMEVSDRTVRNDVRILNAILERHGARIELIRGKGLQLRAEGEGVSLINGLLYGGGALQTREERSNLLLVMLLLSDRGLRLSELEEELYVSHTTLEGDIRYVRKIITDRRPHLTLTRGGNRIAIEAPEWRKRLMLTKIFSERWDYHTREGLQLQGSPLDPELFKSIFELTKTALRGHGIKLDDYDFIAFTFTLAIAEFRIRTGHALDESTKPVEAVTEVPAITELIDNVEQITHTRFNENERQSIMLSISFRQSPIKDTASFKEILDQLDENAKRCTELFLKGLVDEYGVDFRGDEQLYVDLARHIFRLEKRLQYSYERKNAILPVIKNRYVYFFELAMTIKDSFRSVYGMSIGEDEWGYFADCLITAAARAAKRHYPNGIPTAFVSHLGRSDREMLMGELGTIYGNTLDLRGPFSIYEKNKILDAGPELILSTVRLESVRSEMVHIPHMTLSASSMLSEETFTRLNLQIREIHEQLFFKTLPQRPVHYFDPDLFFTGLELRDETEAISFITGQMAAKGYAPPESTAIALAREEWSSTAIDNGIALPRLRVAGPYRTVISVAQLCRPAHWGGQRVSTVFFLSVSESELPIFGTLLNFLSNYLLRRANLKKILNMQSFAELQSLL